MKILGLSLIGCLLLASLFAWSKKQKFVVYRNTALSVAFTGSKSCAASGCHDEISRSYPRTPMGNSMGPANAPSELARVPRTITVYNQKLDRYFQVTRQGSDLYETEYELDEGGNRVFTNTRKLEYRVGGPLTGYTYVIRLGQFFFEAPLSYYNKVNQWDLSPRYEIADIGFNRPIVPGCLSCHNGQPEPVRNRDGMYGEPPFRFMEYSIGCECCHGPGQLHLDELAKHPKRKWAEGVDDTIVNPARLPASLANDICMNCHQGGLTRVLQPGKAYTDFRPGMPLYQTLALFKLPLTKDQRAELERLESLPPVRGSIAPLLWWKNSTLQASRCFHDSKGELKCITCHVIHKPPTQENKVAYYRERCFTCHTSASCKLSLQERLRQDPPNDCIACHMPRRAVAGIPHSDDTNHRIVRRAGQPYPDYAFDEPTPDLPGLVCINRRGEDATKPVPLMTKLLAYAEAPENPLLRHYYYEVLEQLQKTAPDDPSVLAALGIKAFQEQDDAKVVDYLTRAVQKGAHNVIAYYDLAEALARVGRVEESAMILEQGVALWPFRPEIQEALVSRYVTLKQFRQAHEALKQYVSLFPEDAFMRGQLAKIEGRKP